MPLFLIVQSRLERPKAVSVVYNRYYLPLLFKKKMTNIAIFLNIMERYVSNPIAIRPEWPIKWENDPFFEICEVYHFSIKSGCFFPFTRKMVSAKDRRK